MATETLYSVGERKLCCQNPQNLIIHDASNPDMFVQRCKICGCRHFTAFVAPGIFKQQPAKGA